MEHLGKLKVPGVGEAMGKLFPLLGLVTVIRQTMPPEAHTALKFCRRALRGLLNPFCFFTVNEFEGSLPNELYKDIHLHLESCKAYNKAQCVSLFRKPNTARVTMQLSDSNDVIVDIYKGMTVWWTHYEGKRDKLVYRNFYGSTGTTSRKFQLRVRKRDKARLIPEYLDFIAQNSSNYSGRTRDIKIFTNSDNHHQLTITGGRRMWEEVPYKHPSTFDTLAIDPCLKEKIMGDLTSFTSDQAFYQRTGRAWKRGYLLYGPPGTGKSSMIAAMANFLKYDIYDLELSQVRCNGDLRQLLIQTNNRSIIVLEDIDCSVKFTKSRTGGRGRSSAMMSMPGDFLNPEDDPNRVTLSGLLNFVDGLWSCCGDERIFVFTTNHVEKLDKALLRPGRMDMQIGLSYCTFPAFKVLAQNYLSTEDHPLFAKVESAFEGKTMTPAQIAEILIKEKGNVDAALESVISALETNVPESPAAVTENDKATESATDLANSTNRETLISTLQGFIEALQKNPDSSPAPQDHTSKIEEPAVTKREPNLSSNVARHESEACSSSTGTTDLVQSIRATLVKNKWDIDSAIEGIVHVIESKFPNSEHIISAAAALEPVANGTVVNSTTSNGHSDATDSGLMLPNGKSSSPKATLNGGVYRETENDEAK